MFIVRYKVRPSAPGKPLGELLLSDQKTYAVWSEPLHRQCLALPAETPVAIKFRTSKSDHVYLTAIESTRSSVQQYDAARERDEQFGHVRANSYEGQRIAKGTRTLTPLTQSGAMPSEGVR